jgi:uncharacterized protein YkuJ
VLAMYVLTYNPSRRIIETGSKRSRNRFFEKDWKKVSRIRFKIKERGFS